MKKLLISLNLVLLLSVLGFGQRVGHKQDPEAIDQPSRNEAKRSRRVKEDKKIPDAGMKDVLLESGTSLDAKLLSTLDVKKSEVGDEVVLKTTKSIKQDGDVIVPKGTKLIGRITEVQRKTDQDKTSKISMVFESLQNKNLTTPINASIVSIAKAGGNVQATDLFGSSSTSASGSSRASGRSSSGGGGLLGGVGSSVGGVTNTASNTVGGVANTVSNTAGGATNTIGRTVNGVQISQSLGVNAQGSSTLTAENKNLKLQKGTQFQLQLNESIQR